MKTSIKNLVICMTLLIISTIIYFMEILIFRNSHETFFLLFQDLAFLPVEVLLISFILEKYLNSKEKQEKVKKLQIVVSAFYTDIGSPLIKKLSHFNTNFQILKEEYNLEHNLIHYDKKKILKLFGDFDYAMDSRAGDILDLKNFLLSKKPYILRMFENPNLLEHDKFTDMLWSVYHVLDELENRDDFNELSENDMDHLSVDIKRAYKLVIIEWFEYMIYLKKEYPYLFSLATRKNPFSDNVIIIE